VPPRSARRRTRWRIFIHLRIASLVALLVAVFVLHASGSTLVLLHVVRIALIGALALTAGWARRRRLGP
jgi:hypothetical protein